MGIYEVRVRIAQGQAALGLVIDSNDIQLLLLADNQQVRLLQASHNNYQQLASVPIDSTQEWQDLRLDIGPISSQAWLNGQPLATAPGLDAQAFGLAAYAQSAGAMLYADDFALHAPQTGAQTDAP